jgi:hypothetical protein
MKKCSDPFQRAERHQPGSTQTEAAERYQPGSTQTEAAERYQPGSTQIEVAERSQYTSMPHSIQLINNRTRSARLKGSEHFFRKALPGFAVIRKKWSDPSSENPVLKPLKQTHVMWRIDFLDFLLITFNNRS